MGDEEETAPTYRYVGARACGATSDVTAGEEPKVLTKAMLLLGEREGDGEATFVNGDTYKGSFAGGSRSGTGTYVYAAPPPGEDEEPKPPVATYEGKWVDGEKSGVGVMTFASGVKYHGSFSAGKYEGQGTMYYANGDIYCGEWLGGVKHGKGTYIYKESGAQVEGTWLENVLQRGVFTDKFGNAYSGEFPADATSTLYAPGGTFSLVSGATCEADGKAALEDKLDKIAAGHHAELAKLFHSIDADGDGSLDSEELRAVLTKYMGLDKPNDFDAAAMMKAFDTHGTPDGRIDQREFRWYMADWALCMRENWDPDEPNQGDVVGAIAALDEVIADFQAVVAGGASPFASD